MARSSSLPVLTISLVTGWWLFDLQNQWRALVEYQYGWIVLLLAGYILWKRWETRPPIQEQVPIWVCSLFVLAGVPFVVIAELHKTVIASTPASSLVLSFGCVSFLIGTTLQLGGWPAVRHFLFPILFMFVAVPLPAMIWNPIVVGLQGMITACNVELLNFLGIPAAQQGNVIKLPNCSVGVDEACSGVRSLQSAVMISLFVGFFAFRRMGSRTLFLLAGIGLALVGNLARSLWLSITAHASGPAALARIHDTAGWSVLAFTTLTLLLLAHFAPRNHPSMDIPPAANAGVVA